MKRKGWRTERREAESDDIITGCEGKKSVEGKALNTKTRVEAFGELHKCL